LGLLIICYDNHNPITQTLQTLYKFKPSLKSEIPLIVYSFTSNRDIEFPVVNTTERIHTRAFQPE